MKTSCIGKWLPAIPFGKELHNECFGCQRRFVVPARNTSIDIPEFVEKCPSRIKYGQTITEMP